MIIERDLLVKNHACEDQLRLFDAHFPSGSVKVTEARCIKYGKVFSFSWLGAAAFDRKLYDKFYRLQERAKKKYRAACVKIRRDKQVADGTVVKRFNLGLVTYKSAIRKLSSNSVAEQKAILKSLDDFKVDVARCFYSVVKGAKL